MLEVVQVARRQGRPGGRRGRRDLARWGRGPARRVQLDDDRRHRPARGRRVRRRHVPHLERVPTPSGIPLTSADSRPLKTAVDRLSGVLTGAPLARPVRAALHAKIGPNNRPSVPASAAIAGQGARPRRRVRSVVAQSKDRPGRTVQAVVSPALADELRARAQAERRSISALIRIALEDALAETSPAPDSPVGDATRPPMSTVAAGRDGDQHSRPRAWKATSHEPGASPPAPRPRRRARRPRSQRDRSGSRRSIADASPTPTAQRLRGLRCAHRRRASRRPCRLGACRRGTSQASPRRRSLGLAPPGCR